MSSYTFVPPEDCILLHLADPPKNMGPIPLSADDLKRFSGVEPFCAALHRQFGDRLSVPELSGAAIRLVILPDAHSLIAYDVESFVADIEETAKELRQNSELAEPLPFVQAVKRPDLVPVLKALSDAHRKFELDIVAVSASGSHTLPVLSPACFTQPDSESGKSNRMSGSFPVNGLVRDDKNGHQLLLRKSELRLKLPGNDPKWAWLAIHEVLERTTYLVGTLVRETAAHPWTLEDGARLEIQGDLPLD